ncbi:MAG: hypothetical protein EZS26_001600 [Candidatus Ordinivivax streblomastigis]|uniref:Uncharacterized protein n=1 Tax=Candidatus Ordinivivax streblomastigis TaxID=2540710 RepID=A0A5M8P1P4_9BACT|nr:MAG: hypothetical protein EZS26_001600 [Candidatus Ordinivivax streblomastigis]
MIKNSLFGILLLSFFTFSLLAQEKSKLPFSLHGSIQSDILFSQEDESIGAQSSDEFALTNTYADLNLLSNYLDAGVRFEYLKYPLPGFESDFAGWGVFHFYATGKYKKAKLTVGDFYDQFGNGLIFRTYEERSLGIDNSLRGARLVLEPFKGVQFKALGGQQRRYWEHNDGYVLGSDLELSLDQWIKKLEESNTYLTLGGSFVSKHEGDEIITTDAIHRLNLPENVGAYDIRARLQKGNYTFLAEYAGKANDPSFDNNYIYKEGSALLLSGSYAKSGLSALLQAKRSDNMSFRSRRSDIENPSFINRLPAFTTQQTYALAALYPYATQPDGEWAFQSSFSYNFKRNTSLGGKYGTIVKVNASHIRNIDKQYIDGYDPNNAKTIMGTDGYTSSFFKVGKEIYYQDLNINIDKKLTKDFKLNLMYMNQYFDQWVIQKEGNGDVVKSNIFIAEGKYQINKKMTLRSELQYLNTKQDEGDWLCGVIELSLLPSFMFTLSDLYNAGETDIHYYKALISYTYNAHFIQFGYGRTRAGRDCSGGVCREVPASRGFTLSYNYNF